MRLIIAIFLTFSSGFVCGQDGLSGAEIFTLNMQANDRKTDWRIGSQKNPPWVIYGRVYLVNVTETYGDGVAPVITWRRTGPAIHGRIYFGIRKAF